jgi:hypothetical protein
VFGRKAISPSSLLGSNTYPAPSKRAPKNRVFGCEFMPVGAFLLARIQSSPAHATQKILAMRHSLKVIGIHA